MAWVIFQSISCSSSSGLRHLLICLLPPQKFTGAQSRDLHVFLCSFGFYSANWFFNGFIILLLSSNSGLSVALPLTKCDCQWFSFDSPGRLGADASHWRTLICILLMTNHANFDLMNKLAMWLMDSLIKFWFNMVLFET